MWLKILSFIRNLISKIPNRVWVEIIVGLCLIFALVAFIGKYQSTKQQLSHAETNNAAYQQRLENAQNNLIQYEFTINQLNRFNDSVSNKLKESIKKSGVKEKKIQQLQYMLAHYENADTIKLYDTIFCEPEFKLDTTIGDKWMYTDVHLEYPSTIALQQKVITERTVIIHAEKETVNPTSKCFLFRWFQKKRTVVRVIIGEMNPHLTYEENTFIKTFED